MGNRDSPEEQRHFWIQGTEADGILPMLDRFPIPPGKRETAAQMRVAAAELGLRLTARANAAINSSVRLSNRAQ